MTSNLLRVAGLCLIVVAGCSPSPSASPYGQYHVEKVRHDAAVALIESQGGHVEQHDLGTAVTFMLTDRPQTKNALRAVGDLIQLDSVSLINTGESDWALSTLGDLPTLRFLAMRDMRLTPADIKYLEDQTSITALHLFDTNLDDDRLTRIINALPQLKQLTVAFEPNVTNTSGRRIARLKNLDRLTLEQTRIDLDVVKPLLESHPTIILRYNDQKFTGPESGE